MLNTKKSKLAVAVKLALASSMVIPLSGCLVEGDKSKSWTGGSFEVVRDPRGTVTGLVQDTNGNPIFGASVSLAGETTTTDMYGRYVFEKVAVTNTAGADADTANGSLTLFVKAPMYQLDDDGKPVKDEEGNMVAAETAYLSQTISVTPEAQIDGTNSDDDDLVQNGVTTFIDGFTAEATTAKLAALESTVTGYLKDEDTGAPVSGVLVSLDLVDSGYQSVLFTANAETDADGMFTISGVPNDLEMNISAPGWNVQGTEAHEGDGGDIEANLEGDIQLGNVTVAEVTVGDDVDPGINSVLAIVGSSNDDDLLGRTETNTVVVSFSEAIAGTIGTNSVIAYSDTGAAEVLLTVTSATLSADGKTLTVTTEENLAGVADPKLALFMADFVDAGGNVIDTAKNGPGVTADAGTGGYLNVDVPVRTFQDKEGGDDLVVEEIAGVLGGDADPSVQATIQMHFNGPLASNGALDGNDIFVLLNEESYEEFTATLDGDNGILTVVLTGGAPTPNSDVSIDLHPNAFLDADGEPLQGKNAAFGGNADSVDADDGVDHMGYIRYTFTTFKGRQALPVATLARVSEAVQAPAPEHAHLATFGEADEAVYQLNSASTDEGDNTQERLDALADQIHASVSGVSIATDGGDRVLTDVASFTFTTTANAGAYVVLKNGDPIDAGDIKDHDDDVADIKGSVDAAVGAGPATATDVIAPKVKSTAGIEIAFDLENVVPGDVISLVAYDGFGIPADGTANEVTLTDDVAPGTVLQRSYGLGGGVVASTAFTYGEGGELTGSITAGGDNPGVPELHLTGLLLAGVDSDGSPTPNTKELTALVDSSSKNSILEDDDDIYDAAAYAAYSPSATVGIALSENTSFVGDSRPALSSGLSATWAVYNDVTVRDDNTAPTTADLLGLTTNPITLSTSEHNQALSLAGILQDESGNVSAADKSSQVVFLDKMAPLVSSATLAWDDATNPIALVATIVINEGVNADTIQDISVNGVALWDEDALGGETSVTVTNNADGTTTIVRTLQAENIIGTQGAADGENEEDDINIAGVFSIGDNNEFASVNFADLEDSLENSWNSDENDQVTAFTFAMANNTTPLAVSSISESGFDTGTLDGEEFSITYTFNQPISFPGDAASFDEDDNTFNTAWVLANFVLEDDGSDGTACTSTIENVADTIATYTAAARTLKVDVQVDTADLEENCRFRFNAGTNLVSAFDSNDGLADIGDADNDTTDINAHD